MSLAKIALYLVGALLVLVIASAVVSAIFTVVSFAVWLLSALLTLAILGGLGYGAYKLYSLFSSSSDHSAGTATGYGQSSTATDQTDSVSSGSDIDSLKKQYAAGELSEAEFERKVEQALDTETYDSIDRELQRERLR